MTIDDLVSKIESIHPFNISNVFNVVDVVKKLNLDEKMGVITHYLTKVDPEIALAVLLQIYNFKVKGKELELITNLFKKSSTDKEVNVKSLDKDLKNILFIISLLFTSCADDKINIFTINKLSKMFISK